MNFKKLNLGLVALLLGFGLVMTQSAFKAPKSAATFYGKVDYSVDPTGWVNLSGMTEDNTAPYQEGSYRCLESEDVCKAQFDTPPTDHSAQPLSGTEIEGELIIVD